MRTSKEFYENVYIMILKSKFLIQKNHRSELKREQLITITVSFLSTTMVRFSSVAPPTTRVQIGPGQNLGM